MKTLSQMSETLMSDIESLFYEAIETLKRHFPSGNIDPRKVFETCFMFCDELFLEPTMF